MEAIQNCVESWRPQALIHAGLQSPPARVFVAQAFRASKTSGAKLFDFLLRQMLYPDEVILAFAAAGQFMELARFPSMQAYQAYDDREPTYVCKAKK
ncbi:hypothetical protein [Mesorhizobium amorphae]|uniref:hypothetical protein n=1 Tax=Mesorhizobium amorphae TaxID=71433 RepID=UPI00177BD507